jgi:hypothetical protein
MEPQSGSEPVLSTWMQWELSQYPQFAPWLRSSKVLMTQALALSSLATVIGTRQWVGALQMYASGVRLAQTAWPHWPAVPQISTAESQNELDAQQLDALFSRQAA